jgi:hypothetical protein
MIKPESYITDDLIRAFRENKTVSQSSPEGPLPDVSVQWLAGGCRLYRIRPRAEAPQDCLAMGGAWVKQQGH